MTQTKMVSVKQRKVIASLKALRLAKMLEASGLIPAASSTALAGLEEAGEVVAAPGRTPICLKLSVQQRRGISKRSYCPLHPMSVDRRGQEEVNRYPGKVLDLVRAARFSASADVDSFPVTGAPHHLLSTPRHFP